MLSYAVCSKKINNATVKFAIFSQQPSSPDICVNIAHIRSKTFCCLRKYIKFVKVSFQVLIKGTQCRFENLPTFPSSYENTTLKISLS